MQLTSTKKEILNILAEHPGISQARAVEVIGKAKSTISEACSDLEAKGLIDVDKSGHGHILELCRAGWQKLHDLNNAVGVQEPNKSNNGSNPGRVNLHNFSVRFELHNAEGLADGWRERWAVGKVKRSCYDPTNNSYVYFCEDWRIRITGEHAIIRLEHDIQGRDPVNLKNRAMVEVFDAAEWLQDNSPAQLVSRPADMRIWTSRQHLAIVADPFCQLVDNYSSLDLDDIKFYDKNGTERLWLDNSDGMQHLEAGNAPGENKNMAEDDIMHIKSELYEWLIQNKSAWGELQKLGEVLADQDCELNIDSLQDVSSGPQIEDVALGHDITATWEHRGGHVMGWAQDIGRPVKVLDKSKL